MDTKNKASIDDLFKGKSLTKKQLKEISMIYQNSYADLDIYKHKDFFYVMYPAIAKSCAFCDDKTIGIFRTLPEEKREYKLHLCYNKKNGN